MNTARRDQVNQDYCEKKRGLRSRWLMKWKTVNLCYNWSSRRPSELCFTAHYLKYKRETGASAKGNQRLLLERTFRDDIGSFMTAPAAARLLIVATSRSTLDYRASSPFDSLSFLFSSIWITLLSFYIFFLFLFPHPLSFAGRSPWFGYYCVL